MKQLFLVLLLTFALWANAAQKKEHVVERGETIESIAKLYNTTKEILYELNPAAKTMFYTGMILVIPENSPAVDKSTPVADKAVSDAITDNDISGSNNTVTPKTSNGIANLNRGVTPSSFNNYYITYNASFDEFDHGYYGIGGIFFNEGGWGGNISLYANFGLQYKGTDGSMMMRFGPAYGYVIGDNIMLSASLRGLICTYDKLEIKDNGKTESKTAVNGGITLTPMFHFKAGNIVIGVGYELGWVKDNGKLFHGAHFSIGL
jgi:hypothetical protein